jgi:hypothetical protein
MQPGNWPRDLGLDFEHTSFVKDHEEVPGVILDDGTTVHPMTPEAFRALESRGVVPGGKPDPYARYLMCGNGQTLQSVYDVIKLRNILRALPRRLANKHK